ncbi:hypothetical protein ES703_116939 [subsurface metagenome]
MIAFLGTACGKGIYIAVRFPIASSNSLEIFFMGHFSIQAPQPVHLSQSTYRAFLTTFTLKLPASPDTS